MSSRCTGRMSPAITGLAASCLTTGDRTRLATEANLWRFALRSKAFCRTRACLAIRRTAQTASGPRAVTSRVTHEVFTGRPPGEPAKHRARHQPGAAEIILVENAAHQLAGGEQTRNDF